MADDQFDSEQEPDPRKPRLDRKLAHVHRRLETVDTDELNGAPARFGVRLYRFLVLFWAGMIRTEMPRRASALTYTTILSIFPLIAVISSSASLFYTPAKEQEFMGWIERQFLPSMEVSESAMDMTDMEAEMMEKQQAASQNLRTMFADISQKFRDSATGAGIFGFIGLLVTCGLLYYSIESVVNMTWQTAHRARWTQTLTSFVTVLVFAPIILGLSVTSSTVAYMLLSPETKEKVETAAVAAAVQKPGETAEEAKAAVTAVKIDPNANAPAASVKIGDVPTTVTVTAGKKQEISRTIQKIRSVTKIFGFLIPYISMFLNAIILGVAYSFLPKTKVRWRYAFLGGFLAAATWQGARSLFVYYIYFSSTNRTLADALGVTVIFLIWIYITWTILLVGNLFVYTIQNYETLWAERRTTEQMLLDARLLVAMMVVLARRFITHGGGFNEVEIRRRLGLRQVQFDQLSSRLRSGGLVTPLAQHGFQIARPPDQVPIKKILALGSDISALPVTTSGKAAAKGSLVWLQQQSLEMAGDATLADLLEMTTAKTDKPTTHSEEPKPG